MVNGEVSHAIDPLDQSGETKKHFPCENCNQLSGNSKNNYFIIKGSNECIAIDSVPSKECKEYHENAYIQVNIKNT